MAELSDTILLGVLLYLDFLFEFVWDTSSMDIDLGVSIVYCMTI